MTEAHVATWIALALLTTSGCGGAPIAISEANVVRADGGERPRIDAPTRSAGVDSSAFDVALLPRIRATERLVPGRFDLRDDGRITLAGARDIDLELEGSRSFVTNGGDPVGTEEGAASASRHAIAVWRGPAERVGDDLRVLCWEGTIDESGKSSVATSSYEVLAHPIIPNLIYGFRAGREELGPIRATGSSRAPRITPERCAEGPDRVELIGPALVWASGSTVDPRDDAIVECAATHACAFSRVSVPIERGVLASAVLVVDAGVRPPNQPSDVTTYTFEIDWTARGMPPVGRTFVGVENALPAALRAPSKHTGTVYDF